MIMLDFFRSEYICRIRFISRSLTYLTQSRFISAFVVRHILQLALASRAPSIFKMYSENHTLSHYSASYAYYCKDYYYHNNPFWYIVLDYIVSTLKHI